MAQHNEASDFTVPSWMVGPEYDSVLSNEPKRIPADIHTYVYDFHRRGELEQAERLFRFLCIYDFYNPDYLMGMAAVFQLKAQYAQASEIYAIAHTLAKDDYRALFHAGHCHLALRETVKARQCFEKVLACSQDDSLCALARATLDSMPASDVRVRPSVLPRDPARPHSKG